MTASEHLRFAVDGASEVSALFSRLPNARHLLVLGHGAGAGMSHPFMEKLAAELGAAGVATLRYQFPYMEDGRRVPDGPAVLTATAVAAVGAAAKAAPDLPLFAGGKSMGGRMTSQAAAHRPLDAVQGLVFFGFPLHPPKRPSTKRADHLTKVTVPMLFLQGTRDDLADLNLLRPVCAKLGSLVGLFLIETADHSFHVLRRSGTSDTAVLQQLAQTVDSWDQQIERS